MAGGGVLRNLGEGEESPRDRDAGGSVRENEGEFCTVRIDTEE